VTVSGDRIDERVEVVEVGDVTADPGCAESDRGDRRVDVCLGAAGEEDVSAFGRSASNMIQPSGCPSVLDRTAAVRISALAVIGSIPARRADAMVCPTAVSVGST
jgi:hypothetical protein